MSRLDNASVPPQQRSSRSYFWRKGVTNDDGPCRYGTYDHLMLLFGRLATFTEKDLARKRRVSRPSAPPAAGNPSPPNFPGMVPVNDTVRPPMGFSPPRKSNHQDVPTEDQSDQEMYREALAEWEGIRHALEVFEGRLGPEFHALSPEYTDGGDHPFGQALQYRTYPVAGIWMNYYSALISLYRSHPDMPPAAMQAAGASGHKTAVYANNIGRISVGLSDDLAAVTDISTALAAALLESSFCLFVAGIQVRSTPDGWEMMGSSHCQSTRLRYDSTETRCSAHG